MIRGSTPLTLVTGDEMPAADLIVVGCLQDQPLDVDHLPRAAASAARSLAVRPGFRGKDKQWAQTDLPGEEGAGRSLALRGMGKAHELDARDFCSWLLGAFEAARTAGYRRVAFALPGHAETRGEAAAERAAAQLQILGYRFDTYLNRDEPEHRIEEVLLIPPSGEEEAYRRVLGGARATARGVIRCRELANTPGNVASPEWMEARARAIAEEVGLDIEVFDQDALEERGMGGILAVGRGSEVPPRLLRLSWGEEGPVVALVGKGVTFDTGGISIKPSASMEEMKYDKSGACVVLATAAAIAELGLPIRLRAYVPLAENMPDGRSYRPGDIVTCYNGKTVEILNTDAEGRMLLADALALAVEEKADVVLEYSTLTGAAVVALGKGAAGLYTPNDELASELLDAATDTGERLWRMPLWPEFVEMMKGEHADLKNSGGRWGGANTAAAFLSQFVDSHPRWAHMDIAGPSVAGKENAGGPGATGYGVGLTLRFLRRLSRR